MNVIGIAQGGIRAAWDRMEAGAQRVAEQALGAAPDSGGRGGDVVDAVVDVRLAAREVQANARVLDRADRALGTLLDVRA